MKEFPANPKEMRPRVSICEAPGSATRLQDASLPLSPSAVKELAQPVVGYFEFSSCAINRRSRCVALRVGQYSTRISLPEQLHRLGSG